MYTNSSEIVEGSRDVPVYGVLSTVTEEHRLDMPLLTQMEQKQLAAWNVS